MGVEKLQTRCCIVGGGPAGMMLGYLLARAGIDVIVLEKHKDFLRDFRGDTIHPSTMELMHELGLLEEFSKLPHTKAERLNAQFGELELVFGDFSHLKTRCPYIAFMPQWDFLDFLADHGKRYPSFRLHMNTKVTGLVEEGGAVVGARAEGPEGGLEIRCDLVVGADGRRSTVRDAAKFRSENYGAPMDVLWFRLSRRDSDPENPQGRFDAGCITVMLNRGDYWQCGFVIPKGQDDRIRAEGLDVFRKKLTVAAPFVTDRVDELQDWDAIRLLTVQVDRLTQWARPGLLCIGDAAHAMSPIGGVGINLAIQDAVAAANLLSKPLRNGVPTLGQLNEVQARRMWPTKMTQRLQLFLQKRVIAKVLVSHRSLKPPFVLRLIAWFPPLRRIPARLIGIGFRAEHVHSPEAHAGGAT